MECLEKWLEAPADEAAQAPAIDLDITDTGRAPDLPGGRRADERDLDPLCR